MAERSIFVSHSHEDDEYCRVYVDELRRLCGDSDAVWYDEHNLTSGELLRDIQRELHKRTVFVVIFTKASLCRSQWVTDECKWAYQLYKQEPVRKIIPVTGGPIEYRDFVPDWLYLEGFRRIEAPGMRPYPPLEAARRTYQAVQPATAAPAPSVSTPVAATIQPTSSPAATGTRGPSPARPKQALDVKDTASEAARSPEAGSSAQPSTPPTSPSRSTDAAAAPSKAPVSSEPVMLSKRLHQRAEQPGFVTPSAIKGDSRWHLVLVGAQGSGKGTQAQLLEEQLNLKACASGKLLRDAIARETELGKAARPYYDRGDLVPDELVAGLILERLQELGDAAGIVLDGFPRTIAQARMLDKLLDETGQHLGVVIYLDVPRKVLLDRLSGRYLCRASNHVWNIKTHPTRVPGICDYDGSELYQRVDDTGEKIAHRLDIFFSETIQLVDYYQAQHKLVDVDGRKSIEEVHRQIMDVYRAHLPQNQPSDRR